MQVLKGHDNTSRVEAGKVLLQVNPRNQGDKSKSWLLEKVRSASIFRCSMTRPAIETVACRKNFKVKVLLHSFPASL